MRVGDKVFHVPSARVMTVRSTSTGNGMVGCCWFASDGAGKPFEYTSGFSWQEFRTPTADELAQDARRVEALYKPLRSDLQPIESQMRNAEAEASPPAGSDAPAAETSPSAAADQEADTTADQGAETSPPAEGDKSATSAGVQGHRRKR